MEETRGQVSPGSTPRPSLSERERPYLPGVGGGVAGVYAPAFVERRPQSADLVCLQSVAGVYAPAFVERREPLLPPAPDRRGVAGVYAPAFVERREPLLPPAPDRRGVAGVYAPAFVERICPACEAPIKKGVPPGSTPRPSLSGDVPAADTVAPKLRVAGVYAPAFVERDYARPSGPAILRCRRGLRPGLR